MVKELLDRQVEMVIICNSRKHFVKSEYTKCVRMG